MIEMNQMVYCVGGVTKDERKSKKTEIYDTNTNKWNQGMDLNEATRSSSLIPINNQYLYSIGGLNVKDYLLI